MHIKNVEIKAKTNRPEEIKKLLLEKNADYAGCDRQVDTYFNVNEGRLKLRSGNIENSLIFYKRSNQKDAKLSDITLTRLAPDNNIRQVLSDSLGIKVEVIKDRHIYFIEQTKFHVDYLEGLGTFVEIEVRDTKNEYSIEEMTKLCNQYEEYLGIKKEDLLNTSYSDMVL